MLFAHLEEVIDLVSTAKSNSIEPYIELLRERVCAKCENQDEQGVCKLRDSDDPVPTWCVLDAYYNLIVGTAERVQQMHTGS